MGGSRAVGEGGLCHEPQGGGTSEVWWGGEQAHSGTCLLLEAQEPPSFFLKMDISHKKHLNANRCVSRYVPEKASLAIPDPFILPLPPRPHHNAHWQVSPTSSSLVRSVNPNPYLPSQAPNTFTYRCEDNGSCFKNLTYHSACALSIALDAGKRNDSLTTTHLHVIHCLGNTERHITTHRIYTHDVEGAFLKEDGQSTPGICAFPAEPLLTASLLPISPLSSYSPSLWI